MSDQPASQSTNKWIYLVRAVRPDLLQTGPTETEMATLGRHGAYLEELKARGVLVFVGRTLTTGPETFGMAVVEAADEASAREIVDADPVVSEGLMRAELHPFFIAGMRASS
ncbi:YciI family protein [Polyangium sp. y55x31]|uniref:YciI family protein n=1 Tax=Polyangium sp. y55x31 TaxID=3042688 RepID=UPI00248288CF|nr:YciI family protein [Polyangium sp. y55x31]MDI1479731.1 YciI family protein [Polyangium sp. y55x31]